MRDAPEKRGIGRFAAVVLSREIKPKIRCRHLTKSKSSIIM